MVENACELAKVKFKFRPFFVIIKKEQFVRTALSILS
jgi:hypothetical protein